MSKMDNLRAMREAKYAAAAARSPRAAASRTPAVRPEPRQDVKGTPEQKPHQPALCGHRAISGRECTREQGHSEKSHRYS
jgi:hypothetical protein